MDKFYQIANSRIAIFVLNAIIAALLALNIAVMRAGDEGVKQFVRDGFVDKTSFEARWKAHMEWEQEALRTLREGAVAANENSKRLERIETLLERMQ